MREKVMVFFVGGCPRLRAQPSPYPEGAFFPVPDANPGAPSILRFPTAILRSKHGNPGAVAVRARYVQHCFLAHTPLLLGSALAGVHEAGNVIEDVHFGGGRYGIWTSKPSAGLAAYGD